MSRHRNYICARSWRVGCNGRVSHDGDVCTECKRKQKSLLDRQAKNERRNSPAKGASDE